MRPRVAWPRAVAAGLLVSIARPVYPCGGPESYDIDAPLATVDRYLAAIEVQDDFDRRRRNELRFLTPFVDARAPGADALWMSAYTDAIWYHLAGLDTTASFGVDSVVARFRAAALRGSLVELRAAARSVVERVLNLPAVVADEHQAPLRLAVELLESASQLAGASPATLRALYAGDALPVAADTSLPPVARELLAFRRLPRDLIVAWGGAHPASARIPSVRYVAVERAMKRGIPDGYAQSIRDSVPQRRWKELARLHDDWLASYAAHPLAEWMRLSRLRLAFFEGDSAAAWTVALDSYARYPLRALAEIRYLLQQSMHPPSLDDRRIDRPLRAALLAELPASRVQWNAWWREAEGHAAEPWATRTRERLLWQIARDTSGARHPLPEAFPNSPRGLSPLAGAFRLLALTRLGRTAEALAQADSLGSDSLVAPVRAHLYMTVRRWSDALAIRDLPFEAKQYLVRVMAPDSVLAAVAQGRDAALAREAMRTMAIRLVARGDWAGGARLLPKGDEGRAAEWATAQRLGADTTLAGLLAYARWLRDRNGRLLFGGDKVWYRSINWRMRALEDSSGQQEFDKALPWTARHERDAIDRHFRSEFEMYFALRAYVNWIARAPAGDARRRQVVREADNAYNWLVNWDNNNSQYWQRELERQGIGGVIRRAGRNR